MFLGLSNWGWRGVLFVRAKNWHRTAVRMAYGRRQFCDGITALSVVRDVANDSLTTVTDGNALVGDVCFVARPEPLIGLVLNH